MSELMGFWWKSTPQSAPTAPMARHRRPSLRHHTKWALKQATTLKWAYPRRMLLSHCVSKTSTGLCIRLGGDSQKPSVSSSSDSGKRHFRSCASSLLASGQVL